MKLISTEERIYRRIILFSFQDVRRLVSIGHPDDSMAAAREKTSDSYFAAAYISARHLFNRLMAVRSKRNGGIKIAESADRRCPTSPLMTLLW